MMLTNLDEPEVTLRLEEVQEAARSIVDDVKSLASGAEASKLFPNGITKVDIELKVAVVELKIGVAGPETATSSVDLFTPERAKIIFAADGEGTLSFAGKNHDCVGSPAHPYPVDLTITGIEGIDKFKAKYS